MFNYRCQKASAFVLVVLIFFLFFCAVLGVNRHQEQEASQQSEYEYSQGRKNSEPDIFSWQWFAKDASSFFTFVLALITAVLAGVSVFQLIYLRRADQTARIAARATLKAAEAALTQARVSEKTFIGLERPLILPSDIQITVKRSTVPSLNGIGFNGVVTAGVNFQNYGRTPGIITEIRMSVQNNDWPHRCRPSSDNLIDVELIVPPTAISPPRFNVIQGAILDNDGNFIAGRLRLFLEIRVIYYDAFDTRFIRLFTAQIQNQGRLEVIKGAGYSGEERREAKYKTDSGQKPT